MRHKKWYNFFCESKIETGLKKVPAIFILHDENSFIFPYFFKFSGNSLAFPYLFQMLLNSLAFTDPLATLQVSEHEIKQNSSIQISFAGMHNLFRIRGQKKKKDNIESQSSLWTLKRVINRQILAFFVVIPMNYFILLMYRLCNK